MSQQEKVTPSLLLQLKSSGKRFASLTAYDQPSAKLAEEAGIELVLVGDSVGMVMMGLDTTRPVTFDQMMYHTQAVRRGLSSALLVADMPFEAMNCSADESVAYAKRFIQEGGAEAVKVEGPVFDLVQKLTQAKIPAIGHLGLTPQSVESDEGFKVQAKTQDEAKDLLTSAKRLEEAGVFALVLECIPWQLAKEVTGALKIPTIGIGAGVNCDSQILVWHDLLGWNPHRKFKFVRKYFNFGEEALRALQNYKKDIVSGEFPSLEESFGSKLEGEKSK